MKYKNIFFILLIICFGSLQAGADNDFEGFWQYKVKVGQTALFNPSYFSRPLFGFDPLEIPEEPLVQPENKQAFVGKQEVDFEDIYYTGYFKLGSLPVDNAEIMGNYYPTKFANGYDKMPLQLAKPKKLANGKIQLFWKTDLSQRKIEQTSIVWVVEAEYNPKTDAIRGITVALDCADSKLLENCRQINIAKWQANRIANINYFTQKNYYTKGLVSRFLQLFDRSGGLARKLLKEEFGREDYKLLNPNYLKVPLQAVLKAKADEPANEDYELGIICSTVGNQPDSQNYCLNNYLYWPGASNSDRINTCTLSTGAKSALCCGSGLTCRCLLQNNCQTPNCLVCCQAVTNCTKTIKDTKPVGKVYNGEVYNGEGSSNTSATITNFALSGIQAAKAIQKHTYVQTIITNFNGANPIPHFTDLNVEYIEFDEDSYLPPADADGTEFTWPPQK